MCMSEDILVFDESFDWADGRIIEESKHLGAHPEQAMNFLRQRRHSTEYAARRKIGHTVGARKLTDISNQVGENLLTNIQDFQAGFVEEEQFRSDVTLLMREAWKDAFEAGARAAGVGGKSAGRGKLKVRLTEGDYAFLRRASAHEMRYLNGMIRAVIDDSYTMPLDRRVQMYVESLKGFYNSARVIGLPRDTIIHWRGPNDNRTCPGCRYLFEHSPYTKYTIPTTPKNGVCRCLTNCRDYLYCIRSTPSKTRVLESNATYTREEHLENLRRLFKSNRRTIKECDHV